MNVTGRIFGRMPKMQVSIPQAMYDRVKAEGDRIDVSRILQEALTQRFAELGRREALAEALAQYEAEFGAFTQEEIDRQVAADLGVVTIVRT